MRQPDFIIGGASEPYLRRWHLIPRNRFCNVYLHHFCRSDDERAKHDHPWMNLSILLRGTYLEHTADRVRIRSAGSIVARKATAAHRIELIENKPVWTLFITGPKVREWGFLCPNGWRHWTVFTDTSDSGLVGRGCND